MGFWDAAMALILIGLPVMALCAIIIRAFRYRERKLELEARIAEANAGRRSPETSRLEERVRVLERIATDKGEHLADEIERLRLPAQ